MIFSKRLKALRTEAHMTLEEVGEIIGVNRATIYKYENGSIKNIPLQKIDLLASLFNVSRPYLMGWSDDRTQTIDKMALLPNSDIFAKAYGAMTDSERKTLTNLLIRAYARVQENK